VNSFSELTRLTDAELPFEIPALRVTPTHQQIFMFSAVTWNRHHIHYSKDAARAEGHRDVVAQRALIGNYLARVLTEWMASEGTIERLAWKVIRSAFPGGELTCGGRVVAASSSADGVTLFECELAIENTEGEVVAQGSARVRATGSPS
jgi:hydroxyacyl-ACP dehydratase HTD2-like protein with hotdog domain